MLNTENITDIVENGLCTACGICAGVCPQNCIHMILHNGSVIPHMENGCINCGICKKVCSGEPLDYRKRLSDTDDLWMGSYKKILKVQIKDNNILKNASSGGFVTGIVRELLENDEYDCAFLVDTYNHENVTESKLFMKNSFFENTFKSRYVTVSHEKAVRYILDNKEKKVILVGTSCFIHGITKVIEHYNLDRDNYFLIGLFCNKTMSNNVYFYFKQHPACKGGVSCIHFRDKEAGNAPGEFRFFENNGSYKDMPRTERMCITEYFELEGCLYCLDKLNILADVSVGDNYILKNYDKHGVSSVVIRSVKAMNIWKKYSCSFYYDEDVKEDLLQSQNMEIRKKNLLYSTLKPISYNLPLNVLTPDVDIKIKKEYMECLRKIKLGKNKASYDKIQADIYMRNTWKIMGGKDIKFVYQMIYATLVCKSVEYILSLFRKN